MKDFYCCILANLITLSVIAQHVRYEFSAPNAVHHEAEITVVADKLSTKPVIFKMSRSSPGRYAKHEFGKNVYNVRACDAAGKPLTVTKDDADVYRVTGHKGTVKFKYTLFANYADGTYASVDIFGYHLNMPATFIWIKGLEKAPISLHISVPDKSWKIANQLKRTSANPFTFTAPDMQYFMDSPIKVGNLHISEWTEDNPDKKRYTFRLAMECTATDEQVDSFTEKVKRVVLAAKNVFGELPSYDYGTYTFIASINPFVIDDGMEHRNSTMITESDIFNGSDQSLSAFTHEFFHCWNVERIRPKSLEPFNFEKSNMSEALWVAEGFTQYYGELLIRRAGLYSDEEFLKSINPLVNAKMNTPGAQLYTPVESSQRAVFADAGVSIDATNYPNMFTTYYYYGGALALALDLELRSRFGKSLDDVMTILWKKHGKKEIPYILPDVQAALAAASGDAAYAADFFKKYVYSHEAIDYKKLLTAAGYSLTLTRKGKAWIGTNYYDSTGDGIAIKRNTIRKSPLYNAGADVGDTVVELDGRKLSSVKDLDDILGKHKPGQEVPLIYIHHNQTVKTTVLLQENPTVQIEAEEKQGEIIDAKQRQFRVGWLDKGKESVL